MRHKRVAALLLAVLLLIGMAAPIATASVYFTMINSSAPEALQTSTMPFVRNGNIYVPLSSLRRVGLTAASSAGTVRLTLSRDSNVYVEFDLDAGTNVTNNGDSLSAAPVSRFGGLFFPVGSTGGARSGFASHFGINFHIVQTDPAPIVRLYNTGLGNMTHGAVLRDGEQLFGLSARYNTFTGNTEDEGEVGSATVTPPPPPPPPPTPPVTPPPDDEETPEVPTGPVALSFVGLTEETPALLGALRSTQISAGFFLTAEDVQAHPDLVRRLHGEGHRVGIFLTEDAEAEFIDASEALFEAARLRTVLVTAETAAVADEAEALGLVVYRAPILRRFFPAEGLGNLPGNLLLDSESVADHVLISLPGAMRSYALRVVSFVQSLI